MMDIPDALVQQPQAANGSGPPPRPDPGEGPLLMAAAVMHGMGRLSPDSDTGTVGGAIENAAQKHGLDPATLKGIASIESSWNPGSNRGAATQYKGLFQIGREEWRQYGHGDIYNAKDNADAAAAMLADHSQWFTDRYGRAPAPGELYMMHQQGRGFFQNGTLTNVAGNPYPGMRGPQTPQSFAQGWSNELARRMSNFGAVGAANIPSDVMAKARSRMEDKAGQSQFINELYQQPIGGIGIDLMRAGAVPKVGELSSQPSTNIEQRSGEEPIELPSDLTAGLQKLGMRMRALNNDQMAKSLGIDDLQALIDKYVPKTKARR